MSAEPCGWRRARTLLPPGNCEEGPARRFHRPLRRRVPVQQLGHRARHGGVIAQDHQVCHV